MNYNSKNKSTKNDQLLNFSSLKQFNEYIKVYKSYLNIKEKIEKYYIKNKNAIFEVFQNLLYLAINGYGTKYEYENSIAIKQFTFDKFAYYNEKKLLQNNKILKTMNTAEITGIDYLIKIDDNYSIIGIQKVKYENIYSYYIVENEYLLKGFFQRDKYIEKCNREKEHYKLKIPKYQTVVNIIKLGTNEYLLLNHVDRLEIKKLFLRIYDTKKKDYKAEDIILDENKDNLVEKIHLLNNKKILIICTQKIYIYKFDKKSKSLECIKEFSNKINNINNKYYSYLIDIFEFNNGDIIFNYRNKLVILSGLNYQIKTIIFFQSDILLYKINNTIVKIR